MNVPPTTRTHLSSQHRLVYPFFNNHGHASLIVVLGLVGVIIAAVWTWHHLSFDTQDYITDEVVPIIFVMVLGGLVLWIFIKNIHNRRSRRKALESLRQQFIQERSPQKRFDHAIALIELNNYELNGLEPIASQLAEAFLFTYSRARGDKQHRIRGMAVSHLGIIQHRESIPLLMRALEDDHAYVRGCAALALGRMRAKEAKEKLTVMMTEDWDQTVRSRSREAVERMT